MPPRPAHAHKRTRTRARIHTHTNAHKRAHAHAETTGHRDLVRIGFTLKLTSRNVLISSRNCLTECSPHASGSTADIALSKMSAIGASPPAFTIFVRVSHRFRIKSETYLNVTSRKRVVRGSKDEGCGCHSEYCGIKHVSA